jgi:hypothetical protein
VAGHGVTKREVSRDETKPPLLDPWLVKASTKGFLHPRQITDLGDSLNCNLKGSIVGEAKAS